MPADAPAPSALDALLAEVDDQLSIERSSAYGISYAERLSARYRLGCVDAPRLAAIVRVLLEAVKQAASFGEGAVVGPEFDCPYHAMEARHTLARAEAIARGEES